MNKIELLEDELLRTLSHFEPMSIEFIYLDLDKDFLQCHPELTIEDLGQILIELVKMKKVKKSKIDGQETWIKIFPNKKPWWKKLFRP